MHKLIITPPHDAKCSCDGWWFHSADPMTPGEVEREHAKHKSKRASVCHKTPAECAACTTCKEEGGLKR